MSHDFISDILIHPAISEHYFLYLKTGSWSALQFTEDLLLTVV